MCLRMNVIRMKFILAIVICFNFLLLPNVFGKSSAITTFSPRDNFLISCGANVAPNTTDNRVFKTDAQSTYLLSAKDVIRVSIPSSPDVPSALYLSARIFRDEATYSFPLNMAGWHWIRLYFFPLKNNDFDLTRASFSVTTDESVLLHTFSVNNSSKWMLKEFLVNATTNRLSLHFSPLRDSAAFINAIEVVSAPDILISDSASLLGVGQISGLSQSIYQTMFRLNVGGPALSSANDTLGRTWNDDQPFLDPKFLGVKKDVAPNSIIFPEGTSPLIAPSLVYATATGMADPQVVSPNINLTWRFDLEPSFDYLLRLHFCDIISKSLNNMYINVYVNSKAALIGLDLATLTGDLLSAYYKDYFLNSSLIGEGRLTLQIGPTIEDSTRGVANALLNGMEVFKMNNSVGSLDGEFGVDGKKASTGNIGKIIAITGIGFAFAALIGVGSMAYRNHKRAPDWERRNSFSSWLLPIHAGHSSFMNNSKGSGFGSHKSGGYTFSSTLGLGRNFTFAEIQTATKNFDENGIIGVGGFGNVYLGELDDKTQVAVKRGNPQSEQGINEFQTEIQMLSKLRHRHLVSLIGYCDENSEMILVYEYMANGPFRDHIYGKNLSPLSWKQRLEICIGAARGLHYLHTGTAQGIIHRDVKTTNILLDENFVAKVSDFGLSKDAPGMNQTHVSTAVKGSFGYLDPEYFRCQQLTDKSDVYSFGVVLLEALCARPVINPQLPREQVSLAEWALQWKRKGLLEKIIDPILAGTINKASLNKFAEAAEKCLAEDGASRPSMGDVLWNLEYALQLQDANPPTPEVPPPTSPTPQVVATAPRAIAAPPPNQDVIDEDDGITGDTSTQVRESPKNGSPNSTASTDNSSTSVAKELFVQLSGMQGR
ncbi:hypothetical protein LUZ60_003351 [Juncus effusus]|nr:hypothetical protein LUZ60_003351 [Juncus effusus]